MTKPSEREHFDVVIIGAGMAGCAAAQALAVADRDRARRILIIDRHRGVSPRFAGEFIHPRGAQILEDLGFYGPLKEAGAVDVDGFTVLERADGRCVELPYDEIPKTRPYGLAVHHKTLVRVMRAVIGERPQVELREGCILKEVLRGRDGSVRGAVIDSGDGPREVTCDLLVGADGKASAVRKQIGLRDERQTIGFTVGIELRDAAVAATTYANVILGAWGPVLVYPIAREEDGSLLFRMTMDLPHSLPAKGARLVDFLFDAFIPFLPGELAEQAAAAILARKGHLEMAPTVNLPAPRAVFPGLALVGDAAGCSHPITA
ncbi:MAG: FAD-dependent monooxygenase, partial [Myxococcales bacterium]|nr:FAD-dependent monooxygenase [Myxococcales bacterium]